VELFELSRSLQIVFIPNFPIMFNVYHGCIFDKPPLRMHPSISFVRIEIILVVQYCHYHDVPNFDSTIKSPSPRPYLSGNIQLIKIQSRCKFCQFFFFFFCILHSYILCIVLPFMHLAFSVSQTMVDYKIDLACLTMSVSLIDTLKGIYACLYFEL
jgi:hypothetical protein